MSPNSLRVLAGAAAAVLALLTAIAVGLVSRHPECGSTAPQPSASASPPSPAAATTASAQLGNRLDNRTQQPADVAPPVTTPTPVPPASSVAAPATCTTELVATIPALTALLGTALTAVAVLGLLLVGGRRRPMPAGTRGAPPGGVVVPPGPPPRPTDPPRRPGSTGEHPRPVGVAESPRRADADRAALVRACIYVRDRVTSRALADRLAAALHDAGVTVVEPVGDRFDPSRHEAGGATPSTDPTLTGTIAAVEVPGYTDRGGQVLRAPVVTVYQPAPAQPAVSPTASATTQTIRPQSTGQHQAPGPPGAVGPAQPARRSTEEER